MPEEFNIRGNNEQSSDGSWEGMDVRAEAKNSESNLADRIRNEMTLTEINELDIKNLPDEEYAAVKERIKQFRETGNAGPIASEAMEVVKEKVEKAELPPKIQETKEKAANHPGFNSFINKAGDVVKDPKKLAALGLAAMIATGAGIAGYQIGNNLRSDAKSTGTEIEQNEEAET